MDPDPFALFLDDGIEASIALTGVAARPSGDPVLIGMGVELRALDWLSLLPCSMNFDFFRVTCIFAQCRKTRGLRSTLGASSVSSAQGFIAVVTLGVGMFIGGKLAGWWAARSKTEAGLPDWPAIWYFPAILAAIVMVAFLILFKDRRTEPAES